MAEGSSSDCLGEIVKMFRTYEDYLDSQIRPIDLFYLEDRNMARQLLVLGSLGNSFKNEEFETMKAAEASTSRLASKSQQKKLASAGKELKDNFLRALAEREEANRSGKMASIIFISGKNSLGQEISGYIDYSHRLKTEDFEPYFSGKKRLMPRPTDLSYYNWVGEPKCNDSLNYEVLTENINGMLFRNKKDRKILDVDPEASPGHSYVQISVQSDLYVQVVIYDHIF
ncbi:cilia- and flagella-associated protein 299 [Paramisgurnus dabryanus]|uniref:cilia- and flagella-associated protein 299 n=1 Tax=Paramisgurnus dabryanus TaxID=90735 RepID=UPI003CCF1631